MGNDRIGVAPELDSEGRIVEARLRWILHPRVVVISGDEEVKALAREVLESREEILKLKRVISRCPPQEEYEC